MWLCRIEIDRKSPYRREETPLVGPFSSNDDEFIKLEKHTCAFDRAFHRARTALVKAQQLRKRAELASFREKHPCPQATPSASEPEPVSLAAPPTEIGFVPSKTHESQPPQPLDTAERGCPNNSWRSNGSEQDCTRSRLSDTVISEYRSL
jgi:hypothetical protein